MLKRVLLIFSLLVLVGLPMTHPTLAKYIALSLWQMGYAWAFPRPAMPGPIEYVGKGEYSPTRVIITFDDAGTSMGEEMFPIMRKHRLPCTQFIVPMLVGGFNFMTWDQIREVHEWGCKAESHTLTHADLTKLSEEAIRHEITKSRDMIQEMLGYTSTVIATPEGKYNKLVLDLIKKAGYIAHLTGYGGEKGKINDGAGYLNPFELIRFDVKNYHKPADVCDAVKRAEGKPQLLIFVYHFSISRADRDAKRHYQEVKSIKAYIPEQLTVFDDVFDEMMKCIAQARDEGRIRVTDVQEALRYYKGLEEQMKVAQREVQERYRKESFTPPPPPPNAIVVSSSTAVPSRAVKNKPEPKRGVRNVLNITQSRGRGL